MSPLFALRGESLISTLSVPSSVPSSFSMTCNWMFYPLVTSTTNFCFVYIRPRTFAGVLEFEIFCLAYFLEASVVTEVVLNGVCAIHTSDYSYDGLFVPWTFRAVDYSYHGRFVLWTFVPFTNITCATKANVYMSVCLSRCLYCVLILAL